MKYESWNINSNSREINFGETETFFFIFISFEFHVIFSSVLELLEKSFFSHKFSFSRFGSFLPVTIRLNSKRSTNVYNTLTWIIAVDEWERINEKEFAAQRGGKTKALRVEFKFEHDWLDGGEKNVQEQFPPTTTAVCIYAQHLTMFSNFPCRDCSLLFLSYYCFVLEHLLRLNKFSFDHCFLTRKDITWNLFGI